MDDSSFYVFYKRVYKYAAYYRNWWPQDWELLTTAAFEVIDKDMCYEEAWKKAMAAMVRIRQSWQRGGYEEPGDIIDPETGTERDIREEERIEPIYHNCPICGKELLKNQKTCSAKCRKEKSRLK